MNYLKWHLGEPRGWFLGFILGFPLGLWLVQRIGPENPSEESLVALFLLGPLILALLLVVSLFL